MAAHPEGSQEVSPHNTDKGGAQTPEDPLDKGLAEAFGETPAAVPSESILRALESRTGSRLGVHLESNGPEDSPVTVTDETKKLRDPSGRYQMLGEIGRGAVGVVYKGRDEDLGRDVAMKVLKDDYANRPDVLARFVEEAQIGGQLQHPGIVPVYGLGIEQGERPYFAMKLVKGETLAAQLARRNSPTEDRRKLLGVFEQVCQTIAYAHARRVVHRDLKPANVMIGAFGEVQVVDWGFAKVLPKGGIADEKESMTRASQRSVIETVRSTTGSGTQSVAGSLFGTPAYMPPEQALGDIDRLDQRSDVFGLGAILCEILTGAPPYLPEDGDLVRQAAAGALEGAYERLQKCGADDALIELCTECLSRARRARPESAAELAERVSDYLTSVEERARHAEVRAAKAHYKHRVTVLSAAAALVVLALGTGTWIWVDHASQERRADAAQRVAAAMTDASGAHGKAMAAGLNLALWNSALESARQLQGLAADDDVEQSARQEARSLLSRVEEASAKARAEVAQREQDDAMVERLQNLRIPTDDDVRAEGWGKKELSRLDAEYSGAFAEYLGGTSLLKQPAESSVKQLDDGDIQVELATSLDHWSVVRDWLQEMGTNVDAAGTAHIRAVATLLDGDDSWRSTLRQLLPNAQREGERLRQLADQADFARLSPAGCRVLVHALVRADEGGASLAALRRGQEAHPQDFDLCFSLALSLELCRQPRWEEALATYRITHALKPDHDEVLHRQGMALQQLGRHVDAERVFRRLLARAPTNAHWLNHVGTSLSNQGRLVQAVEIFRAVARSNPENGPAYKLAGVALKQMGKLDEAIKWYRKAIEVQPDDPENYSNLGNALSQKGNHEEAIRWHKRAVEADPKDVRFHDNLGVAYRRCGKNAKAIESYENAIKADPRYWSPHYNLGYALWAQGKFEAAIEHYRDAVEVAPRNVEALWSLANALRQSSQLDEAIARYQTIVSIVEDKGSDKAQASLKQARAILEKTQRTKAMLDGILSGRRVAKRSVDWTMAVKRGYRTKRFREIVSLAERTLRTTPELTQGGWGAYNSACAAALLAADTEARLSAVERARVRGLAREWLARQFERWKTRSQNGDRWTLAARKACRHAVKDPDFASVRGEALEQLPEGEGDAWRALWRRIEEAADK